MAEPLRKYTARDVREHSNLRYLARDYAFNYTGEFEFMVDCQNQVRRGDPLNDYQVKAVLNCMLHDPRAHHLLPNLPIPEIEQRPRRLRVVPEPARIKPAFSTLIQWNMDYLISTWKQTNTVHLLDRSKDRYGEHRSYLKWSPGRGIFWWYLKPVCSTRLSQECVKLVKTPPQGRHMCRWCLIVQGQRAEREMR
jgi:hypothetical protein